MKNSKSSNFNFQYSRLSTFKLRIVCLENFVADYPKDGDVLYFFFKDRSININSIGYFHTKRRAQSGSSGRNTTESDWFFRILNNFQWITVRNHCMRQCGNENIGECSVVDFRAAEENKTHNGRLLKTCACLRPRSSE